MDEEENEILQHAFALKSDENEWQIIHMQESHFVYFLPYFGFCVNFSTA